MRVKSHTTKGKYYTIKEKEGKYSCTCPDHKFRKRYCKHILEYINKHNNVIEEKIVKSHTNKKKRYTIKIYENNTMTCNCPDFTYRKRECKHIKELK